MYTTGIATPWQAQSYACRQLDDNMSLCCRLCQVKISIVPVSYSLHNLSTGTSNPRGIIWWRGGRGARYFCMKILCMSLCAKTTSASWLCHWYTQWSITTLTTFLVPCHKYRWMSSGTCKLGCFQWGAVGRASLAVRRKWSEWMTLRWGLFHCLV